MEKTLRVLGADSESSHTHSHSHNHSHSHITTTTTEQSHASGVHVPVSTNGLVSRSKLASEEKEEAEDTGDDDDARNEGEDRKGTVQSSKLSAYLNLFGDFVHNMWVITLFITCTSVINSSSVTFVPARTASRESS